MLYNKRCITHHYILHRYCSYIACHLRGLGELVWRRELVLWRELVCTILYIHLMNRIWDTSCERELWEYACPTSTVACRASLNSTSSLRWVALCLVLTESKYSSVLSTVYLACAWQKAKVENSFIKLPSKLRSHKLPAAHWQSHKPLCVVLYFVFLSTCFLHTCT